MNKIFDTNPHSADARAILVGANLSMSEERFERSMTELRELAKACNLDVADTITQMVQNADHGTLIGSGKIEEIKNAIYIKDADIVVFSETLSPLQIRNLEKALDTEVIDRTGLILQIFSSRARTREAKLQVESAQLQYMLPRLAGMRAELSRQGGAGQGGSGRLSNKGAGEKKIELDRRHIEKRISELRKELENVERERTTQRGRRLNSGILKVSLVGYTNAGKSTLMNKLLEIYGQEDSDAKKVFEKDMLFATLDTTVRKIAAPNHRPFLLSDTVGFIDELPHTLVKAFRSTLDEVKFSDVLLEVIDYSDPDYKAHLEVTTKTLAEIGAGDIPVIYVYNKVDKASDSQVELPFVKSDSIYMSAKLGIGIEELLCLIEDTMKAKSVECDMLIPYSDGSALASLNGKAVISDTEYLPEGTKIHISCSTADAAKYEKYIIN
ncbi:MAG: GTPase HflX [Butyrivibrio sp.]|nr:GTPase HflX [Butyrivibrio sp.]